MARTHLFLALALVTTACVAPTDDTTDDADETSDALSKEPAAKAGEPKPTVILHLDDAAGSYRDTAGGALACEANCPTSRTLGLFGSTNTGARMDAIELVNPTQRSGVSQTYSLKSRQCLAYPASKVHTIGDDFTFSGWFLLRATPRPGYAAIFSRWDAKTGGARQFDVALKTKKSNGASTVYASFRKVLPNGQEVEVLGQALYATSDSAATKRFQNQWHHLVIRGSKVGTQADIEVGIDGVVNTGRVAGGIKAADTATHVGCNVNTDFPKGDVTVSGGDPYDSFDGKLDEFVLYDGHASNALVGALRAQSKPATEAFGFLVGAPHAADGSVQVDDLLDRLKEMNASRYALEVKKVSDLTQGRRVLEGIEARIAANKDADFWRAFRLTLDGRVQNYGGLHESLTDLGKGLVQLKKDHPNSFAGFKIDDFSTTAKTDSSMINPDRLAVLCDQTMVEPALTVEPVVYCNYPSDPGLKEYGGLPWTKKGAKTDHAMFRDLEQYLKTDYKSGKYARCLSGVSMYVHPNQSGKDRPTYSIENANQINGCLADLRTTGLPITEGIYTSSISTTPVSELLRTKNIEAARGTTPNAFEAFTLALNPATNELDGSGLTRTLQAAYADRNHFIRW